MDLPDLANIVETFVRIGLPQTAIPCARHLDLLREDVSPLLRRLTTEGRVRWYCFLIHDFHNGVPVSSEDRDLFWHLRLEPGPGVSCDSLIESLPVWCEPTQLADPIVLRGITGPDVDRLRRGSAEAWRLLGEQSEWLLDLLDAYKDEVRMAEVARDVQQYLHYFANMTMLEVRVR